MIKGNTGKKILEALGQDETVTFEKRGIDWDFIDCLVRLGVIQDNYTFSDKNVVVKRGPKWVSSVVQITEEKW